MPKRPNIIQIITEQHRGDCLSADGHPVLMTPNLDLIGASGVRFSRAYTTCPTCIAARRSILSGQYPPTHGMVGYHDGIEWDAPTTLPQALADAGYHTYDAGRGMHQTPRRKRYGFQHMVDFGEYHDWLEKQSPESGGWRGSGIMNNDHTAYPWPLPDYMHSTNWIVQRALEFLEKRDPSCPFFLNVCFLAAHPPLQPPRDYFERYIRTGVPDPHIGDWARPPENKGIGMDVGSTGIQLEGEKLLSARAGYYGLINHLDDQIRRLLYPATGGVNLRDTLVVFTSDHGEMLGDHYRWHKIMPYESAARIPMLIQGPPELGIQAGTVIDELVSLEDVMPTILDMAGIDIPETVEGKSLLPAMRGATGQVHEQLHIEHANSYHCLTSKDEKYVWMAQTGEEQLFDMINDPHELHDMAKDSDKQDRLEDWRNAMVAELKDRPEGFSDGKTLIPGRPYNAVMAHAMPPEE